MIFYIKLGTHHLEYCDMAQQLFWKKLAWQWYYNLYMVCGSINFQYVEKNRLKKGSPP